MGLEVTKTVIWLGGRGPEMAEELAGLGAALELPSPGSCGAAVGQGSVLWGRLSEAEDSLPEEGSCSGGMTATFFSSSLVGAMGAISRLASPGGFMVTLGAPELSRS